MFFGQHNSTSTAETEFLKLSLSSKKVEGMIISMSSDIYAENFTTFNLNALSVQHGNTMK